MDILGAQLQVALFVLGTEGIAVLTQAHGLSTGLAGIGTFPAEGADAHAVDGHYPSAANDVLALIHILDVDALAVEHAHLVVQQVAAAAALEEIALELKTDVTTVAGMHARAVAEARQFAHRL